MVRPAAITCYRCADCEQIYEALLDAIECCADEPSKAPDEDGARS